MSTSTGYRQDKNTGNSNDIDMDYLKTKYSHSTGRMFIIEQGLIYIDKYLLMNKYKYV